jgi:hypothetical protein
MFISRYIWQFKGIFKNCEIEMPAKYFVGYSINCEVQLFLTTIEHFTIVFRGVSFRGQILILLRPNKKKGVVPVMDSLRGRVCR